MCINSLIVINITDVKKKNQKKNRRIQIIIVTLRRQKKKKKNTVSDFKFFKPNYSALKLQKPIERNTS